ncbi:MAG: monovalent cation/H(+) antiporter subunit G [Cyanobacteria bacterium P01_D01_bin.105]
METFVNAASFFCLALGALFWVWGSAPLLRSSDQQDSILLNLHTLSVSDTLGSMSILVGLLFQLTREWPLLLLALFALAIWNTVLSYVLAYCYYAGRDVVDKYGVAQSGMPPSSLGPRCILPNHPDDLGGSISRSNSDSSDSTDTAVGGRYV